MFIYKDCGLHIIKHHKVYKVRRLYFMLVKIKKIMEKSVGDNNHKKISLEAFPPRTLWWTLCQSATFTDPQHPALGLLRACWGLSSTVLLYSLTSEHCWSRSQGKAQGVLSFPPWNDFQLGMSPGPLPTLCHRPAHAPCQWLTRWILKSDNGQMPSPTHWNRYIPVWFNRKMSRDVFSTVRFLRAQHKDMC